MILTHAWLGVLLICLPDEVGGGRGWTWSVPPVAKTAAGVTSNALLEASSEAFELSMTCSGSSGKPIEASTKPFEVPGRAREASSKPNEASSSPLQASTRVLEASTKALELGYKWRNPSNDNHLRPPELTRRRGSVMTQQG